MQRKALPSYGWLSRVRMKREKASSAFRISVGRLAFRPGVFISDISNFDFSFGLARSGVFRRSGVLVFKEFLRFMLFFYKISSEFRIDAVNLPHNVFDLMDGGALENAFQVFIERITAAFEPSTGRE